MNIYTIEVLELKAKEAEDELKMSTIQCKQLQQQQHVLKKQIQQQKEQIQQQESSKVKILNHSMKTRREKKIVEKLFESQNTFLFFLQLKKYSTIAQNFSDFFRVL